MGTPASGLEGSGVRIAADGSIILDRASMAPSGARGAQSRMDHVVYPVANRTLAATFENPGRIASYEAFCIGPILEPGSWRQTLSLDGAALTGYPPRSEVRGQLLVETWWVAGCHLTVSTFADRERNVVYQAYELESEDEQPHTLEASIRAGFLADQEECAYGLHFDERHGAIVAILGRTELEPGCPAGREGEGCAIPPRAALIGADMPPAEWRVSDQHAYLTYRLKAPARGARSFCLAVTGGWTRAEHESLFLQATLGWRQSLLEARRHGDWLARRLETGDDALHGLFTAGLNCALAAYREDHEGRFQGLVPRPTSEGGVTVTIPGDAYWCAQALLPFEPTMVRGEILALARAVAQDGQLAWKVRALARQGEAAAGEGPGPYDASGPACDSPSYLAMLLHDYLAWTGDQAILDERPGRHTVWESALACVNYLRRRDTNHDYLFEKEPSQPDWAFDIRRDDWVTYDLALHCQALKNMAEVALLRGEEEVARDLATWEQGAARAINERLWSERSGSYVDYIRSYQGFVEDHASIDTVVAVLYGIGPESRCHRHLERLERLLETRHNDEQYYGDWGVMNCFPFYKERSDLTGVSAWAYSYHNGAGWPGWSGVFGLAELLHRRPDWRYALERWWTYSLGQYWFTPTEYYAPPYDAPPMRRSAALYAWSAMPAAAMILGGFGFWPNIAGEVVLRVPPWGDSRLNGVRLRGEVYDVLAEDGTVHLFQDGDRIASSPHGLRIQLGRVAITGA